MKSGNEGSWHSIQEMRNRTFSSNNYSVDELVQRTAKVGEHLINYYCMTQAMNTTINTTINQPLSSYILKNLSYFRSSFSKFVWR